MENFSILYLIIAGIINAAFIVPTKFLKSFSYEQAWFYFGIFGSMILPWLFLVFYNPKIFHDYALLDHKIILFVLIGGFIFGLGQSCFSFAIKYIGIAKGFAVNLSTGAIVGSFAVIMMNHALFTKKGLWTCIALLFVVIGLGFYYFSDANKNVINENNATYSAYKGWMYSILAGVSSGMQNILFVYVTFHSSAKSIMHNTYWIWPLFLFTAGIAMSIQFWRAYKKNHNHSILIFKPTTDIILVMLMGICSSGSLIIYSYTMGLLSNTKQIIGWPLFMISIILSTQIFGKIFDKEKSLSLRSKVFKITGVGLLVIAIILLSIGSYYR